MHIGGIPCASLYFKRQKCFVFINVRVKTRGVLCGGTCDIQSHIDAIEISPLNIDEFTKT